MISTKRLIGWMVAVSLLIGGAAQAGSNWESYGMNVSSGEEGAVLAAIEKFMATKAGKKMPGSYSLMISQVDGADPSTHSIIWATESIAEREKYTKSMEGNADWAALVASLSNATDGWSTYRMAFNKTWGDDGNTDSVWYIHALVIRDAAAYEGALDALMSSAVAKKFKGSMTLSTVVAGGITPASHVLSVGYANEAEAEAWDDALAGSPAYAAFEKATAGSSEYKGTSIINTIKAWGTMTP
jgi:hypothetical protein